MDLIKQNHGTMEYFPTEMYLVCFRTWSKNTRLMNVIYDKTSCYFAPDKAVCRLCGGMPAGAPLRAPRSAGPSRLRVHFLRYLHRGR